MFQVLLMIATQTNATIAGVPCNSDNPIHFTGCESNGSILDTQRWYQRIQSFLFVGIVRYVCNPFPALFRNCCIGLEKRGRSYIVSALTFNKTHFS